jgi:hypothetical protein
MIEDSAGSGIQDVGIYGDDKCLHVTCIRGETLHNKAIGDSQPKTTSGTDLAHNNTWESHPKTTSEDFCPFGVVFLSVQKCTFRLLVYRFQNTEYLQTSTQSAVSVTLHQLLAERCFEDEAEDDQKRKSIFVLNFTNRDKMI